MRSHLAHINIANNEVIAREGITPAPADTRSPTIMDTS